MQKVDGSGGNLGEHIDGKKRPVTAAPRDGIPAVTHLDSAGESIAQPESPETGLRRAWRRGNDARKYIDECRQKPVRGRKPAPCVAFMFGGPPPYGAPDAWDQQTIRAWAAGCVKWAVSKAGPGSRIARCALHQDETSPHVHLVLVAADESGRLGWNRIRQGFGITGRERGPELMSAMQTSFHREVGHQFGLERGGPSTRRREPIDREKGLEARVEEERKRADEMTATRNQAVQDQNDWVGGFLRALRALNLERAALEKAEAAGGFKKSWLVEQVERVPPRRGLDR